MKNRIGDDWTTANTRTSSRLQLLLRQLV